MSTDGTVLASSVSTGGTVLKRLDKCGGHTISLDHYVRGAYISLVPETLRSVEFHILLALSEGDRHGYAILQEAQRRAGPAALALEAGTLYRALRRLRRSGLVAEAAPPPDVVHSGEDDDRRRYYRMTAKGRSVAAQEAERLAALVRAARATGLLGRAKA